MMAAQSEGWNPWAIQAMGVASLLLTLGLVGILQRLLAAPSFADTRVQTSSTARLVVSP
jgi:hypothetical protein